MLQAWKAEQGGQPRHGLRERKAVRGRSGEVRGLVAAAVPQQMLRQPHIGELEALQGPGEATEAKPATVVNRPAEFATELVGQRRQIQRARGRDTLPGGEGARTV